MTKKIAISVPDDVAERLSAEENVSAYVTEAVRQVMRIEQGRASLEGVGIQVTEEGIAHWRAKFTALNAKYTAADRAAIWAEVWDGLRERLENGE